MDKMRLELVSEENRVYLSPHEFEVYCKFAAPRESLAARIMGNCGPRVSITADARRGEFYNPPGENVEIYVLEIQGAKDTRDVSGDDGKHRFTWCPQSLYSDIEAYCEERGIGPEDPVFDVQEDRLGKTLSKTGNELAEATGEEAWSEVTSHDFRIFFATQHIRRYGLPKELVMDMGGWDSHKAIEPYLEMRLPIDLQNDLLKADLPDYLDREVPEVDVGEAIDRAEEAPEYSVETQVSLANFDSTADDD